MMQPSRSNSGSFGRAFGLSQALIREFQMSIFDVRRESILRRTLEKLDASHDGFALSDTDLKHLLTQEELEEYRIMYREAVSFKNDERESSKNLPAEAARWWKDAQAAMRQAQSKKLKIRNKGIDLAGELVDEFANLSGNSQRYFRPSDITDGKRYDYVRNTENELPVRKKSLEDHPYLHHVRNYAQRQFISHLLDKLAPAARDEAQIAAADAQRANAREMIKRLLQ